MGSGAKSSRRKGFLIYEEMHKYFHHIQYSMRRSLVMYDFAPVPSEFLNMYMRKTFFSFLSVHFILS